MEMSVYGVVKAVVQIIREDPEGEHQVVHRHKYLGNALVVQTANINLGGK